MGGPHGPYRQSERREVYKSYVDQLVERGLAYPCFCTDEELEAMKKEAEEKKLPPIYRGKWAAAAAEEAAEMMAKGVPHCYRFRVPKNQVVTIKVGGGCAPGWKCGGRGWSRSARLGSARVYMHACEGGGGVERRDSSRRALVGTAVCCHQLQLCQR